MSKVVEFPKMMYHEDGEDTRLVESAEAQEGLGRDWVEEPVHPDHGRQAPKASAPVSPAPNEKPADEPAKKKAKKKGDNKGE